MEGGSVSLGHTEIWNTPKPALPTGLAAQTNFDERSVALSWDDPLNPSITRWEYQVKQGPADWGDWLRVDPSDWSTTSYTVENLTLGGTYHFKVQAVNWSGTGESEAVEVTLAGPPEPPELTVEEGHEKVFLSWSPGEDNGSAIQRHERRYSTDGGVTWNPDWTPHSVRRDTLRNLVNDTEYTFQMRARNEVDYSEVAEAKATPRHPIRGPAAVDFAEHSPDTVGTYRFHAPVGLSETPYRLRVSDIEDSTHFELDGLGRLRFRSAPDFEEPRDTGEDNLYVVWLRAAPVSGDGGPLNPRAAPPPTFTKRVEVTVTDVNEPGRVTLSPTRPRANQALTATLRDPDGVEENPQWVWSRSSQTYGRQAAAGDPLPTLREQTVYPHPVLVGRKVMAKVTYRDRHGAGQRAESAWSDPVIDVPSVPLNLRLTPGHRKVHLTWEPPLKTHGSALTGYGYRQDGGGETTKDTVEVTTSHTVDGLTNGTAYTFKVWAINGAGRGKGTDFVGPVVPRPDTVSFDASSYVATEDGDTATVKVHMPRAPVAAVTVKVTVRPGPGTEAGDFETVDLAADSTVSFTASAATDSFRIVARPDADSDDESVLVGFKDLPDGIAPGAHPTATVDLLDVTLQVVGPDSVKVEENRRTVAAYRATDPSDAPVAPVTWSLSGDDAPRFRVDGNTLEFVEESRPDYEQPVDDGGNNVYHVDLMAEYGGVYSSTPFSVVVTVTDVDEPGKVTMSPSRPHVGDQATATLTDPDGVTGPTWSWRTAESRSRSPSTQSYRYTVPSSAAGQILRASVSYTDAHGRQSADTTSTGPVLSTNRAPVISGSAAVTVDEDSTRVGTYAATDADGDRVTWSRAGADSSAFTIGSTGALRFGAAPDYEAPADADGDSVYSVEVVATDPGKAADTLAVSVSVRNVDEPGVVSFSPNPPKVGQTVTATVEDPDGGVRNHRNWHWSHADAPRGARDTFSPTGQYTPTAQNVDYRLRVTVTYDDAHGSDKSAGGNSGPVPPPPSCVLTLTASESSPVSYAENGTGAVATYTVTRSSGCHPTRALSWTLSGADASAFEAWTGSGSSQTLEFNDPPDHETQSSYRVTAGVTDGSASTSREVTVNVTDVNEPPAISGPASKSVPENTTEVATYTATDPEDDSVTWELVTGSGTFRIGRDSGVLAFQSAKDYEALTSYTYTVKIRATDDGSPEEDTTRTVTVTVTNVNEPGTVTLSDSRPYVGDRIWATLTDPDGGITGPTWAWSAEESAARSPPPPTEAVSYYYTVPSSAAGQILGVSVSYSDVHGSGQSADTTSTGTVRQRPCSLTLEGPAEVDYDENGTGPVATYTATASHCPSLSWTLSGADASSFEEWTGSGSSQALEFKTAPDHETKSAYAVTVGVRAGSVSKSRPVTVRVTNVPEAGTITLDPTAPQTCAHTTGTLRDEDGGIRTTGTPPPGFTYGWTWDPPPVSRRRSEGTSTTQSYLPPNSAVGRTVSVTVGYRDNASDRNTVTKTSGTVRANAPRAIPGFTATGGRGRADLAWTAPNDCGASVTYTYKYRLSGSPTWTTDDTTSTSVGITGLAAGAYEFELTAGNSAGHSGTETATATVTPVNRGPAVTGPDNPVTVPEGTPTVGTYTGTDPDGDRLTWTTGSGFSVSPTSGAAGGSTTLAFDEAPNYEVDARSYSVSVQATDPHGASHSYAVTIAVGNEDDPGEVTVTPDSPRVGETVNAVLSDEDGGIRGDPWSWSSAAAASRGEDGPGDNVPRVGDTWTAWKSAVGRHLVASRTYSDNHGAGKSASGRTQGVVRPNKPKAPPGFEAAPGDGQVTLSWGAADNRGAAIDYYQYRRSPGPASWSRVGGANGDGNARSQTVTGLTNGTTYTFYIRGHNSEGFGPSDNERARPAGKPSAPKSLAASQGSRRSTVSWSAADSNGSHIRHYEIRRRAGTDDWSTWSTVSGGHGARSKTVFGLTNGIRYTFEVVAENGLGEGPAAAASVTPAGPPGAPQSLATDRQGGHGFMELTWEEADSNGSAIQHYYYRYKEGDGDWRGWYRRAGGANARSKSWTNFNDGSSYTFQVRARNPIGYGTVAQTTAQPLGPGGSAGDRGVHEETEDELMPEGEVPEPGEDDLVVFAKPVAEGPAASWLAGADSLAVRPGPNPFNPETTLRFQLPEAGPVTLAIHNTAGQVVAELIRGEILEAGLHTRVWSGTDEAGRPVASGLYLYRLVAGGQVRVGKLALIR